MQRPRFAIIALLGVAVAGCASLPRPGTPTAAAAQVSGLTCRQLGTPQQRCGTAAQWRRYDALTARRGGITEMTQGFSSDHVLRGTDQEAFGAPWPPSQCCTP